MSEHKPIIKSDALQPGNFPLDASHFDNVAIDEHATLRDQAVINPADLYMPMGIAEFCATDLAIANADTWANYLRMKVRMVRDRRETVEAKTYFDNIQTAFEESFTTVTPTMLDDSTKMNLVRCVDPYTEKQLDDLNFSVDEQIRIPGGLIWFDLTGTMENWVVPRIFNESLAAGMHRNCGGLAIVGALNGERQMTARDRALTNAQRIVAETASVVKQDYLKRRGRELDTEEQKIVATFGGPKLIFPIGAVGTAEDYVTPKALHEKRVDEHYTPRELVDKVEVWIDKRIQSMNQE